MNMFSGVATKLGDLGKLIRSFNKTSVDQTMDNNEDEPSLSAVWNQLDRPPPQAATNSVRSEVPMNGGYKVSGDIDLEHKNASLNFNCQKRDNAIRSSEQSRLHGSRHNYVQNNNVEFCRPERNRNQSTDPKYDRYPRQVSENHSQNVHAAHQPRSSGSGQASKNHSQNIHAAHQPRASGYGQANKRNSQNVHAAHQPRSSGSSQASKNHSQNVHAAHLPRSSGSHGYNAGHHNVHKMGYGNRGSHSQYKDREQFQRKHNDRGRNPELIEDLPQEFSEETYVSSKPISFTKLHTLTEKSPNEIILTINPSNCGFSALLRQKEIKPDMMALVLIALGKSCTSDLIKCVGGLINSISNNQDFLITSVSKYLVSIRQETMKYFHKDSLLYLTLFLQKYQHTLPSSSSESISIVLPLLKVYCEKFLKEDAQYSEVIKRLDEIDDENELFRKQHTPAEIKKFSFQEKQHLAEPPENYRSIPILPNADDVQSPNTFLRPNIVEGKYLNTEHYLDVQYRLLREDYIRPLREGIGDYLRLKKAGKGFNHVKDVRVYKDVTIVKQDFVNGGIVHIAQFSKESFSKIKWEYSKRFLSGSLLCLSSDDFETMMFASVARRLPQELTKGLLLIRFEEISDEVLNLTPLRTFVVIETTAYFEAYRYNLKALHDLNTDNLPFQKYIINVQNAVDPPQYLDNTTTYDMRPLLLPLDEKYIKSTFDDNGDVHTNYEFPSNIRNSSQSVRILNDSSWPSETDLNLDHSQFLALKAAVSKEFTIIQGPPGTGKTYIGLRIVQLLLHNIESWQKRTINSLPILVVCFTNHALDQFLEGLLLFTKKIVRIGGRGTNEDVAKYQLSMLKQLAASKKEIPKYINFSLWQKNNELRSLKQQIDKINESVQKSSSTVLGENLLKSVIPDVHYGSLKSIKYDQLFRDVNLIDDGSLIHDWLGIRSRIDEWQDSIDSIQSYGVVRLDKQTPAAQTDNDDLESIGEADIEFIEAQRDIDAEDFAGVSFDIDTVAEEEEFRLPDNSGWQVQGGKKRRRKYIRNSLLNCVPFKETEAMRIKNVWSLNVPQRWQLYRFWLEKYVAEKQLECIKYQQQLKTQYQEVCEMRTEGDIFILQKAHIVGMTTTGAAKYRDIVLRLNPQILIVEEAAEILESHIVTSLAPRTQHVILIGDHQQLRPSPTVHALAVNYGLNISLFERMLKNKMECWRLLIQHRMRPEIAELIVPHIYSNLENHESVTKFENIKGVSKNVFFVTHNYNESAESDSKSKVNEHEAKFLIKLCKYFTLQGYDPSKITVLTTYSGQLFVMKKLVERNSVIQKVRMTVVDNYQGEESEIILISFVRSNEDGQIGFLKVSNRVCVALSRARKGLFCIGNFGLLAEKSVLWKNIVRTLNQSQAIGSSLQLMCQNHPGVCSIVASEKDFESVPEGGCSRMCEYRLSCGHVCSLMCHPYDKAHENVRCYKECNKTCEKGHKCLRKCYKDCGPCKHQLDKFMYHCSHTIKVECHKYEDDVECNANCDKFLSCGHRCSNICSRPCVKKCEKIITIKSPMCGHDISVTCYDSKNSYCSLMEKCQNPCNAMLSCGHLCSGNCADCYQGRLHMSCKKLCTRILVCGHACKSSCSNSCPPCQLPCENRCVHSRCPKTCGEPCEECIEPCEWSCTHVKCSRFCGELCNRIPCNEPCPKLLPCKHPCIGFCGEPCPDGCRKCDNSKVKEIFFGTEDDEEARFIQLEDCNHILEISGLAHWMETNNEGDMQIQMKTCPKCKTVIRRNLRFGNIVKGCLKQIEKVKVITYGNVKKNKQIQKQLLGTVRKARFVFSNIEKGISIYEFWIKILSSTTNRSNQQITTMENIFKAFIKLSSTLIYLEDFENSSYITQDTRIKLEIDTLTNFMNSSTSWILNFVQDEFLTASEEQLQQLTWEIHRMQLGMELLKFVQKNLINPLDPDFERCISCINNYHSFTEKERGVFSTTFQTMVKRHGSAVINISELEKGSILKAMGLSKGHWYQCPNGHVYCITECGGAMVESRCNECNERIGGTNHRLINTNRVARAMDGATHSAWSDTANMANYLFDD